MAAARHLSVDGTLASVLFAYKLENAISGILARNLDQFSSAQLNKLAIGLDSLPSGSSLRAVMPEQKKCDGTTYCLLPKEQGLTTN